MVERLALVDHSFHRKTRSSCFFLQTLRRRYQVTEYYDDSWCGGPAADIGEIRRQHYDVVVFFQTLPRHSEIQRGIGTRNVVLVPMYDAAHMMRVYQWSPFAGCKFVCFSKALHRTIEAAGGLSRYVQYYPDPAQYQFAEVEGSRLVGFFWQRRDEITWRHIRALVDGTKFERLLLHLAPDPGFRAESPSRSDLDTHSISVSTWFRDQSDYAVLCARANVYFAPRIREGIGMSFLEAMARGNCVVAADQPTMNEYIRHGENGLLFDPRCPEPLDFSCAKELGRRARSWVESGHTAWVEAQESLLEYLATPVRSLKRGPHFVMRRSLNSFHHWASRFAAGLRRSALRWLSREARNQR